jgi:hypothetical protein
MILIFLIIIVSIILIVVFGWDGFVSIVNELYDQISKIVNVVIERSTGELGA